MYFDRFSNDDVAYMLSFVYGLRMDTIAASYLLIIPLILLSFTPKGLSLAVDKLLRVYFAGILGLIVYMENATFPFFAEYDVRPNFKFVEYLEYPKEVFAMIFAEYKLAMLLSFVMIALVIWVYMKMSKNDFKPVFEEKIWKRVLLFIPLALLVFIGIRSSFGHRAANSSDAMYSSNRIINEITKNTMYNVAYSIYANQKFSSKVLKQYGKMPIEEALNRVRKRLDINSTDAASLFSRLEKTHFKSTSPKNLVVFLQESIGYQFSASTGG